MAHYAFLDANNYVTEIIVGVDEDKDNANWEYRYGQLRGQVCKRTSFNTVGGVHLYGGTPFRKNYAGIGYYYDAQRDAFIPPKPFTSWRLNEDTCLWEAPTQKPQDGNFYTWDETTKTWIQTQP